MRELVNPLYRLFGGFLLDGELTAVGIALIYDGSSIIKL